MSKHNYTQYSNKKNKNIEPNNPEIINMSEVKMEDDVVLMRPIEIVPIEETVETVAISETVEGTVVNCAKLNVRAEPAMGADVLCVLDAMSEIEIIVDKSTKEWFYVCTAIGVEGYCMRKFVDARL